MQNKKIYNSLKHNTITDNIGLILNNKSIKTEIMRLNRLIKWFLENEIDEDLKSNLQKIRITKHRYKIIKYPIIGDVFYNYLVLMDKEYHEKYKNFLKQIDNDIVGKNEHSITASMKEIGQIIFNGENNHSADIRKTEVRLFRENLYIPFKFKYYYNLVSLAGLSSSLSALDDVKSIFDDCLKNSDIKDYELGTAFVYAFLIEYYFLFVHPYEDGNGRVSRLLSYKILRESGISDYLAIVPLNAANLNRFKYSRTLCISFNKENPEKFIYFMIKSCRSILGRSKVKAILNKKRKEKNIC